MAIKTFLAMCERWIMTSRIFWAVVGFPIRLALVAMVSPFIIIGKSVFPQMTLELDIKSFLLGTVTM